MTVRVAGTFSVLIAGALAAFPARAQSTLNDADLRTEVAGKSFARSDGGLSYYDTSGEYSFVHPNGHALIGKWTIAGGQICIDPRGGRQGCFKFERDPKGLRVTTSNGDVFQLTPVK